MEKLPGCTCAYCAPNGPTPMAQMKGKWEADTGRPFSEATHAERADVWGKAVVEGLNRHTRNLPDDYMWPLTRKLH